MFIFLFLFFAADGSISALFSCVLFITSIVVEEVNERFDEFEPRHHAFNNVIISIASVTFAYDHCQREN